MCGSTMVKWSCISLLQRHTSSHSASRSGLPPQPELCPVVCLLRYLHVRPVQPGALFVIQANLPIQYPTVLKLFHQLAQFLDLPAEWYMPHSLRIEATTELYVKGFSNSIIKQRGQWVSAAFQRNIRPNTL